MAAPQQRGIGANFSNSRIAQQLFTKDKVSTPQLQNLLDSLRPISKL
jgi:hypothetical protein